MRVLIPIVALLGCTGPEPSPENEGCTDWLLTYDLTGTLFEIDAMQDFTITLQEPYDDDLNMGPGRLVVRVGSDEAGAPAADGPLSIVTYQMTQNFVTGVTGVVEVETDLENLGEAPCGLATGTLAGGVTTWETEAMGPVCQTGEIRCTGSLCGTAGTPTEDEPRVIDTCDDRPLGGLSFSTDMSSFTSDTVVVSQDESQTTRLTLMGTQVDAVLVSSEDCSCD